MLKYWDDVCGGGLYWNIPSLSDKNAIGDELLIELSAALHNRIPGDAIYLEQATEAWQWFNNSGLATRRISSMTI